MLPDLQPKFSPMAFMHQLTQTAKRTAIDHPQRRSDAFRCFLCLMMSLVVGSLFIRCPVQAVEPPNVILLLADDLGWTGLGCFGSDFYETPHLDKLAQSGMKFTNAYAACTVCSPTRASIMTGIYPARLRLTDFIAGQNRPFAKMRVPDWTKKLETRHITLPETLRAAGYRTAHVGKWHLSSREANAQKTQPTDHGFDVSYERPAGSKGYFLNEGSNSENGTNYLTDALTDKACHFIRDSISEPFFLYFAYNVPHTPIQGRQDLVDYFAAKADPSATHDNPKYAAMVASLDQSVGRILAELTTHELLDNTIIIFTSDNGGLTQRYGKHDNFTENLPLRRGKGSAYEGGVRVPAIIRWPGVTKPGLVCHEPIMTTDYFPTILEMTGTAAKGHSGFDGFSLVPLLQSTKEKLDRNLFWHYPHYHAGGDGPYSAIRAANYRLIEFHEDQRVELYDLQSDLGELHNLAEKMPAKTAELQRDLNRWRHSVDAQMPSPNPTYDPKRATQVRKKAKRP